MNIVMALSGGMDSTTMLAHLLDKGHNVKCLIFTYGSKHNKYENAAAVKIADHYRCDWRHVDMTSFMEGFTSALMQSGEAIPEGHYTDATMSKTVVPARNIIFLSVMAGYAWSWDCQQIAIGIHQGDHAIYEDCRKEFYKAMDSAIYLGTGGRVEIVAPFVDIDKTGILGIGMPLGVPYELTRTCYKDQVLSCGLCGSCRERLEAFANIGRKDPVMYEVSKENIDRAAQQPMALAE